MATDAAKELVASDTYAIKLVDAGSEQQVRKSHQKETGRSSFEVGEPPPCYWLNAASPLLSNDLSLAGLIQPDQEGPALLRPRIDLKLKNELKDSLHAPGDPY